MQGPLGTAQTEQCGVGMLGAGATCVVGGTPADTPLAGCRGVVGQRPVACPAVGRQARSSDPASVTLAVPIHAVRRVEEEALPTWPFHRHTQKAARPARVLGWVHLETILRVVEAQ